MSCNSEGLLMREGADLTMFAPGTPVLARLSVKELRLMGLEVVHRPLDGDYSHCNVLGVKDKTRKKLLKLAEIIRCPPDVHKS